MNAAPLRGRTSVAVDATGVGKAVVDNLKPKLRGSRFHAITITSGNTVTTTPGNTNVPKRDLISTCQLLFQNGRLKIAAAIPDAAVLVEELLGYRITISENGHDSYGPWRERDHDDLLLALALAAWTAENRCHPPARVYKPTGHLPDLSQRTYDAMYAPTGTAHTACSSSNRAQQDLRMPGLGSLAVLSNSSAPPPGWLSSGPDGF